MTPQEVKNIPLKEMFDAVLAQLNLTEQEERFFRFYYGRGYRLYEVAEVLEVDVQTVQKISKKVKFKLAFIDTKKVPYYEELLKGS